MSILVSRRRVFVHGVVALVAVVAQFRATNAQRGVNDGTMIHDVTIISPERNAPLLHADVVIRNGRITEVGTNVVVDPQTRRINGLGRFLTPS
jgi:imidazolonepropionase-like amidohydrolase